MGEPKLTLKSGDAATVCLLTGYTQITGPPSFIQSQSFVQGAPGNFVVLAPLFGGLIGHVKSQIICEYGLLRAN